MGTQKAMGLKGKHGLTESRTRWKPRCPAPLPLGDVNNCISLLLLHLSRERKRLFCLRRDHSSTQKPYPKAGTKNNYWRKGIPTATASRSQGESLPWRRGQACSSSSLQTWGTFQIVCCSHVSVISCE